MTQREEFEAWWEEFSSAHEDWRFADSDALRWATWQAAKQARPEPSDDYLGKAYRLAKELFDHLAVAPAQPERAPLIPCRCFDEVSKRLCVDKTRCSRVEAHGIKQGGQHD